jgi:dihydrofolate reductase
MRKLISYIAVSLNGKIARTDGRVDWLENAPNPDKSDYGFADFYDSVDATIQGNKTYEQVKSWDMEFPYKGKENYVISRNTELKDNEFVRFLTKDPVENIRALKAQAGKNIWLIGGGSVNTLFYNAGLLDELRLFIMPIIIPDGIELFTGLPNEKVLTLSEMKRYKSGAVELRYSMNY